MERGKYDRGSLEDRLRSGIDMRGADECWLWMRGASSRGYGTITLARRTLGVHRVAFELAHGPLLEGELVRHSCDTPLCCNPAHLLRGTPLDNMRDKIERGRARHRTPDPVLTARIKTLLLSGAPVADIAERVGCSQSWVYKVKAA